MSDRFVKILKNVFLSSVGNRLKLVDIQFSDRVEKVIDRTSKEVKKKKKIK